jgi:uncharacterized membrane protein
MASSKARPRNRPAPGKSGRATAGKGSNASRTGGGSSPRPARPQQAAGQATVAADQPEPQVSQAKRQPAEVAPEPVRPAGPPLWLQIVTLVLALGGLGVSIYETWAHFNGSHLFACNGNGSENCTAVITSPQSMVFGVIPVAILGLIFYVFVVAIMSPWAWRIQRREVGLLRLAAMVAGMGFVVYLIYAELYDIGSWCLYCTSVHIITFLLFCITVVCAAVWGLPASQARGTTGRSSARKLS